MNLSKYFYLTFVCLVFATSTNSIAASQGLDANEAAIVAWSAAHTEDAIDLLESLVDINSGSLNKQGVKDVGVILRKELDELGFETRWIEQPEEMKRGGHLFGTHGGDLGKKILLIGHLDTVFEPDDGFQTFVRHGSKAVGPGVEDMKSGDVIIIYALKALQQAGVLDGSQIMVAFTGDEESTGKPISVSRKDLIDAGEWADVALGFEAGIETDGKEWATIARRSSSSWCLEVKGKQAHSAGIFSDRTGAGAIFEAARILSGFYEEVRGEEYLTFNAGTIMGGTEVDGGCVKADGKVFGKTNVVPNRVVVRGGMRTISQQQLDNARDAMRAVVASNLPLTEATISFTDSYPPMAPTDGNRQLRDMLSAINQDLGRDAMPILDASRRGAADISFVAPYTDGLAGMGAYGKGGHTPNESLDLTSIPIAIQRAAILIYRLSR
jgi:glutamate carboxypeptidase